MYEMENSVPQMKEHRLLKIQIIGGPGSGKTMLGAEISARFHLPFYEMDVFGMKNGADNSAWVRDAFAISSLPDWVVEGGGLIWNDPILTHADSIVLLEVAWRTASLSHCASSHHQKLVGYQSSSGNQVAHLILDG